MDIKRVSAYDDSLEIIAENVVCMLMPDEGSVKLDSGVATHPSDSGRAWEVLLQEPNSDVAKGDLLLAADITLKVFDIRRLENGNVMCLACSEVGVP